MLGEYHLGDCMDYLPDYPDNYFDLAIVDPDYGIERFKKSFGTTRFKTAKNNGADIILGGKPNEKYFKQLFRVTRHSIIWGGNNFILPPTEYFIIWNKKQTVDNFSSAEYAWTNVKQPAKVFDYSIHKNNSFPKYHPTQKPVALYKWLLKNYAKEGDLILDTHVGSASSLIACEDMGFTYVGYEKDPDYYRDSMKRLKDHLSQITIFDRVRQDVEKETITCTQKELDLFLKSRND